MSKTNRAPIDYTPQYSDGIFRPKEVVQEEVAQEAGEAVQQQPQKQARPRRATRPISQPSSTRVSLYRRALSIASTEAKACLLTFRFQPDELAELDAVAAEISQAAPGKLR